MTKGNSTALITGGTSGIGFAAARQMTQLGIHVLVTCAIGIARSKTDERSLSAYVPLNSPDESLSVALCSSLCSAEREALICFTNSAITHNDVEVLFLMKGILGCCPCRHYC
jgi:NAD(P)-dependent dehydrogenase (short-subunit alcohol dehydrogenase family)